MVYGIKILGRLNPLVAFGMTAFHEIGNRGAIQFLVKDPGGIFPCQPHLTVVSHIAFFRVADTLHQIALAFKQSNDLAQRDLLRLLGQHMTAFGPSDAFDQFSLFQWTDELFKVFHRDVLALGNFADLNGSLIIVAGQVY